MREISLWPLQPLERRLLLSSPCIAEHNVQAACRAKLKAFTIDMPVLATTAAGQEVSFGGFSGLFYEGKAANGNLKFVTNTDRGPNGETTADGKRPFLLPGFSPEVVRLELNRETGDVTITQRIPLKTSAGVPLSGVSNLVIPPPAAANTPHNDESPVDLFGNAIPLDPLGADTEGVVVDSNGSFWIPDEYRPSIYHFNSSGVLIERFVPVGTAAAAGQPAGTYGTEALPRVLGQRRINRGFEGIAIQDGKIYAFVQSPIRNPATLGNSTLNGLRNIRVVEFDPTTLATRQFVYVMDNPNLGGSGNSRADKIGDAAAIGNGEFLVIERDDDAIDSDAFEKIEKKVYRFGLAGATDIGALPDVINGKTPDQMTAAELAAAGITPISKRLHVDLNAVGYNTVEKVEGLTLVSDKMIAVLNDNDFGVADITIDSATGTFVVNSSGDDVVLGLISTTNDLDAPENKGGSSADAGPAVVIFSDRAVEKEIDNDGLFGDTTAVL